jgi:[protein-PII] uridylyltransferase
MPVITHEDFDELTTAVSDPGWEYLTGLPAALQNDLGGTQPEIAAFRGALTEGDNRLKQRFDDDEPVERLVRDRARLVDTLLKAAWAQHLGEHVRELALIAAFSRSCGTSASKSGTASARSTTVSARAPPT